MTDEIIKNEISKLESKMDGKGRVLIRPSGTEPLVRVMIEGKDQKLIKEKSSIIIPERIKKNFYDLRVYYDYF